MGNGSGINRRGNARWLLMLFLCLLCGCQAKAPIADHLGNPWEESYVMVGTGLGIGEVKDLTALENKDILAADGLYYATWVQGEKRVFAGEDGEEADLYPCQLFVLTAECEKEEEAGTHRDNWLAGGKENYLVTAEEERTVAGMEYNVLIYECRESSPYARGISAFGSYGKRAFCMEMTALSDFSGDLDSLLTGFLEECHFAKD